jgi:hypothetical protein
VFSVALLVSRLVAGGFGPIDQAAPDASPALTSTSIVAPPTYDQGGTEKKVLTIHGEGGPTYNCLVAVNLVSADAITAKRSDFGLIARELDCL